MQRFTDRENRVENRSSLVRSKARVATGLRAITYSYLTLKDFLEKINKVSKSEREILSDPYYKCKFLNQKRILRIYLNS